MQRESKPDDFAKVARVIYNRLAENRTLEFDSTVNYPLDRIEVATTDADRAQNTPWNTYVRPGLPATPICSPGQPALAAAEQPAPGDWLYFVTIDLQGTTLFTRDYQQHLANIELAKHNGVLDSARCRTHRKAAVLGSPIAHSRSPQLHLAAYRALGLDGWTYDRIECTADELPAAGRRFRPGVGGRVGDDAGQVRGAAVRRRTHRARGTGRVGQHAGAHAGGVAGRQHRYRRGDGCFGTVRPAGRSCSVPAAPRLRWSSGSAELGVQDITVVARTATKPRRCWTLARELGRRARWWIELGRAAGRTVDVVVSTIPADVAAQHADIAATPLLLDAIYDPWPTPLAAAVEAAGGQVISGLQMLLHQAYAQVEQFTGCPRRPTR